MLTITSCSEYEPEELYGITPVLSEDYTYNQKYEYMDDYFMITASSFKLENDNDLFLIIDIDTTLNNFSNCKLEFSIDINEKRKYIGYKGIEFVDNKQIIIKLDNHYFNSDEKIDLNKIISLKSCHQFSKEEIKNMGVVARFSLELLEQRFYTINSSGDHIKHYFIGGFVD